MPKNCSKDISTVIDYMDNILMHGTADQKHSLKQKFGLESLEHDDDFMWCVFQNNHSCSSADKYNSVLENGPWLWQANSFYSNYSAFYQFCDAIEVSSPKIIEISEC